MMIIVSMDHPQVLAEVVLELMILVHNELILSAPPFRPLSLCFLVLLARYMYVPIFEADIFFCVWSLPAIHA